MNQSSLKNYITSIIFHGISNGLYRSKVYASYNLSISRTNFCNLYLIIISNAHYSNGTNLFLALHGMQRVSGSSALGSIKVSLVIPFSLVNNLYRIIMDKYGLLLILCELLCEKN